MQHVVTVRLIIDKILAQLLKTVVAEATEPSLLALSGVRTLSMLSARWLSVHFRDTKNETTRVVENAFTFHSRVSRMTEMRAAVSSSLFFLS